jgi:hypothetical protein
MHVWRPSFGECDSTQPRSRRMTHPLYGELIEQADCIHDAHGSQSLAGDDDGCATRKISVG